MRDALAWLLDLRLKTRGNRDAKAIVDRALAIWTRAQSAQDEATYLALKAEIDQLADDLAVRYGTPRSVVPH